MPTYRKRGNSWRAEVSRAGIRESRSFPTKREATEWATARETELGLSRAGKVIRKPLADVLDRYAREISPTKAGERWEQIRIEAFKRDPLAKMVMADIQPPDLADWRDRRLKEVKPASVLREIGLLRAVWTQAKKGEWHYVDSEPWKEVSKPADSRARTATFTDTQVERIIDALGYKSGQPKSTRQQAAVALLFSLETAMRAGEIIGLTWPNVNAAKRIAHLPDTKNGDARDVPLSKRAVELLGYMKGLDHTRVFTINSKLLDIYYRQGRQLAGVEGVNFHDARATATTRLAKKLDILELARMTGHRDPRSLLVYYRESATNIAAKLD